MRFVLVHFLSIYVANLGGGKLKQKKEKDNHKVKNMAAGKSRRPILTPSPLLTPTYWILEMSRLEKF